MQNDFAFGQFSTLSWCGKLKNLPKSDRGGLRNWLTEKSPISALLPYAITLERVVHMWSNYGQLCSSLRGVRKTTLVMIFLFWSMLPSPRVISWWYLSQKKHSKKSLSGTWLRIALSLNPMTPTLSTPLKTFLLLLFILLL